MVQADFKAGLIFRSADKPGLLAEAATAISKLGGNITKAEVETFPDAKAQIKFNLIIRDIEHLEAVMKDLSAIKDVLSVERI